MLRIFATAGIVALMAASSASAQVNTSTTVQSGDVNVSATRQRGNDNLATTVQEGRVNVSGTQQRGCINTAETGQTSFGRGGNASAVDQAGRGRRRC